MKRLKTLFMVVCCLLSVMALSSDAFADFKVGNGVYFVCPYCGEFSSSDCSSYRRASSGSLGLITAPCSYCKRDYTRSTKYWGTNWPSDYSDFGIGDVIRISCSKNGVMEDAVVYYFKGSTCSTWGKVTSVHLDGCNSAFIASIPPLGHDYVETRRTPATCTAPGSILSTCSRCQGTKTESLPALGHEYTSKRTEPTCTASGSIVTTCSCCNDTKTEVIPAPGHDYSVSSRIEPTCTTPGAIVSTCSRCNDTVTEEVPVSYHSWDTMEMVPSTYDDSGDIVTEGYTFYTCSTCGSHYTAVAGTSPPDAGPVSDGIGGEGMSDTTAALGKTFLSGIWSLFGIYVPGFGFTFGQMWLGVLLASLSILVVRMIFGFGGGPRGESSRTSSTNNPKISKERRYDEF